jgi:hypothetical protein
MDDGDAGWDYVRCFGKELILMDCTFRSNIRFGVTVKHQKRHHHDSATMMPDQRLPRLRSQRNSIEETTSPIGRNDLAL